MRYVNAQIATAASIPFWTAAKSMPRTESVLQTRVVREAVAARAGIGTSQRFQVTPNVTATTS